MLIVEILPVSVLFETSMFKGFPLRYARLSYLNWPGNGKFSKLEGQKKILKMVCFTNKSMQFRHIFWTSNFDSSQILVLKAKLKLEESLS